MTLREYLSQSPEPIPLWLETYTEGSRPNIGKALRNARLVFYPGSGIDGDPVAEFNRAHAAHTYLYADYGWEQDKLQDAIRDNGFYGYQLLDTVPLSETDLVSAWKPHLSAQELQSVAASPFGKSAQRYGMLCIFERKAEFDDSHGCRRFAVVFLGADGIATYDALFGSGTYIPYALVLQDHGFGCNYSRFGGEGLLEKIAERADVFPELILCGENTDCWSGYQIVPNVDCVRGGMHKNERRIWKHI